MLPAVYYHYACCLCVRVCTHTHTYSRTRAREHAPPAAAEADEVLEELSLAHVAPPPALLRLGRRLVAAGVPEPLVVLLLPSRRWLWVAAWCVCSKAASRCELGPPFVLLSMLAVMLANLGKRKSGELSAYSVFNPGQRALPGAMDAAAIQQGIMHTQ